MFKKIIFCFGWLGVLNLAFWIAMLVYYNITQEDKFWSAGSYRIVYIFGWVYFITLMLGLILGIILESLL